jgi:hypothetical protein
MATIKLPSKPVPEGFKILSLCQYGYCYPFVWHLTLFVLGALGASAWVSMMQAPQLAQFYWCSITAAEASGGCITTTPKLSCVYRVA